MRIYDIKTAHYYRYRPFDESSGRTFRIDFYTYHVSYYGHDNRVHMLVSEGLYERAFSIDKCTFITHTLTEIINYLYHHHRL